MAEWLIIHKILFFKYYNHSKTDGELSEEDDDEMWDFVSCKEMMATSGGEFSLPHLMPSCSGGSSYLSGRQHVCVVPLVTLRSLIKVTSGGTTYVRRSVY